MFQNQIFPLRYQEDSTIKFWIWRVISILHVTFILAYWAIWVFSVIWILKIDDPDSIMKLVMLMGFTLFFLIFGFLFIYLKVFIKRLKPVSRKIILTKDSIQINENKIKLNDIKNIISSKDNRFSWYKIYTDGDIFYMVNVDCILGLDLFLKKNFPNDPEYGEKKQEKKLQQELGEKYYEYYKLNRKIPFEKITWLLVVISLATMFFTNLITSSLILITAILIGCLFFIQKYKIHKLSFLHPYFWICCMLIFVFFIQMYHYVHFQYGWWTEIIMYFFLATLFLLLRALIKSQWPEKYWRALFVISTLVIILWINTWGQWIWEPQADTLKIEKVEYVSWSRGRYRIGSHYNVTASGEKIWYVMDGVNLATGNKIKSKNKATIHIYTWLLGIDFYTY